MTIPDYISDDKSEMRGVERGWYANRRIARFGKWIAGIIAGLIVVAVVALASLIVFGTASRRNR
jgi:hypothetical protein